MICGSGSCKNDPLNHNLPDISGDERECIPKFAQNGLPQGKLKFKQNIIKK